MSRSPKSSKSGVREFPFDDEMKGLKFKRIYAIIQDETLYIENGKATITSLYTDDLTATTKALEQKLIESPEFEKKVADIILRFIARVWYEQSKEEFASVVNLEEEREESGEDSTSNAKPLYLMKYTKGIPYGIPAAEAILLGGTKPMWLQIVDGKAKLDSEIQLPDGKPLRPWENGTYLSKEYEFATEEEVYEYVNRAKSETLDTLYDRSKSFWVRYIDADDYHRVICAATTIFTYFVDVSSSTFYLLLIGDNETGKSNNLSLLEWLAYRPLSSVSLTPAGVYRSYGNFEECQVTILQDEIDNIDQQPEMMRILKSGYRPGAKVHRNDDTPGGGRKSQAFLTYGFKGFTSEKQPDSVEAKGLNERIFVIKCYPGSPTYDISEVVTPAGDDEFKTQLDELVDFRKLAIVYRLLHFNDPIPNIKLNLKNRDKQLCKPIIRLFQGTKAVDEIKDSLWKLVKEKRNRKAGTLEAKIYKIIMDLVSESKQESLDKDQVIITSDGIWMTLLYSFIT